MTLSPRELMVRLSQDWTGQAGQPVRCRVCCAPWGHHANGFQAQTAIATLTRYGGAPGHADGVEGTSMHDDDATQPRAAVGHHDGLQEDER